MYEEFVETGKVVKNLPADDKKIRALHCQHILRKPLEWLDAMPLRPIGTKHVPLPEHPKPIEYQLKVVPVPVDGEAPKPVVERTPTLSPDPVVFDVADEDLPVAFEMASALEAAKATLEAQSLEATTPEVDAELEAVEAEIEEDVTEIEPVIEAVVEEEAPIEIEEPAIVDEASPTPAAAMLAELNAVDETTVEPDDQADEEEADSAPRSHALKLEDPVVDAPSIGPKTASRLEKVDIFTIGDLLNADPEATAIALNVRYIKADTLRDWQDQTRLMVEAPGLRVLDSQILVGAGIRSVDDLAKASATKVLTAATTFLDTPQGARVLWGGDNNVDKNEVEHWIDLAKTAQG